MRRFSVTVIQQSLAHCSSLGLRSGSLRALGELALGELALGEQHLGELAFFVRPLALYIRLESLLRRQVQFLANMHDAFSTSSLFFERFHCLFFDE